MENRKILIVDDEPEIVSVIQEFLDGKGYEIITAGSAEEGLEVLQNVQVAVLLVDLQLPNLNGVELAKRVRDFQKNISIILMTGHPTVDSTIDLVGLGNTDFVIKPIDLDYLNSLIQRAFKTFYLSDQYNQSDKYKKLVV